MNLRFSAAYNPPFQSNRYLYGNYDGRLGSMDPDSWFLEATPRSIIEEDNYYDKQERRVQREDSWNSIVKTIAAGAPIFGQTFAAALSIPQFISQRKLMRLKNARERYEAYKANFYNSPLEQVKRMRMAGINPFVQGYVKNYPANIPQYDYPDPIPVHPSSDTFSSVLNALTNYNLASSKAPYLDSVTAINEYKNNFLYPQLYEANGYANTIASLQVAWEEKNYEYERVLKQYLLETQFGFSLANLGEKLIELRPQQENNYTMVDPVNGQIWIQDENGQKVDTTNWKLSDYPIAYQKAWNAVYRQQDLTDAQLQRILSEANTSSALGALYNANRLKVEQYTTEFEKYGTWPDSDAYLRAAAGAIPWEYINKMQANKLGWSAANAAVGLGADASKIALSKGLGSYFGKKAIPQVFKLPKGARPFINADFNSYSSPYNYDFIY